MRSLTPTLLKIAVFVTVTVLATALLAFTIGNITFSSEATYRAVFSDVTALNAGDDVRINGVRVGSVSEIGITGRKLALVEFTVDSRRKLPVDVRAEIKYRNLVGQRYVALERDSAAPGPALAADATIPLAHTTSALNLTVLFNGFKPLFQALSPDDVNSLSYELIQVLQGEGGTITSLLQHTASLATTIAGKDEVIGRVIDNLNSVLDTVTSHGDQLSGLVTTVQQLVSGLAADRKPIGDSVSALADVSTSVSGLLAQGRDPLKQDIAGLGSLAANLNQGQDLVQQFLKQLPVNAAKITPTATYGSWFNFYACQVTGQVGLSSLDVEVPVLPVPTTQQPQRCTR
ncbi:MCE family protein [Amycolatopsis rhabdoformis]|uniref:MCE family protein n=1 Tax=Amycolatopsis rhabdoformis TaxID=1448059 RepID=A0ABZ1IJQ8_9PSEU|nr:MCE family protein [Amycolatopsis rhabdoformis]WSE33963.1 MCE family protein [Amycolatopsis rhabdoformis]